jgi:hypothetical protein
MLWADEPEGAGWHVFMLAPKFYRELMEDCEKFLSENYELITNCTRVSTEGYSIYGQAGHDFWLTRRGHGAGFWDGDWEHGDVLTEKSEEFGNVDIYLGDDGLIYGA